MIRRAIAVTLAGTMSIVACSRTDEAEPPTTTTPENRAAAEQEVAPTVYTPGDPAQLPPLPGGTDGGPAYPIYTAAVVTPASWVSSSFSPTLTVPDASGAWTFTISDFGDGESGFGPLVYQSDGNSVVVPLEAGLEQGRVYTWVAQSPGQEPRGGAFQIDVQLAEAQHFDTAGGLAVGLSSGEVSFAWSSHVVASAAGSVGFGLRFALSNTAEEGVPAGWDLQGATSVTYTRIEERVDGTIGLVAADGTITNYRAAGGDSFAPVRLSGTSADAIGAAPVITRDPDGDYIVTAKQYTAQFRDDDTDGVAHLVGVSAGGRAVLSENWTDGLLRAVIDPVSGRQIDFDYGGGNCPTPPTGFVTAPTDMVCQVRFWDGSTTALHYVETPAGTVSIGRIVDHADAGIHASVVDIAYDAAGRIARTRSPLVASAAASGVIDPADAQYWTEVAYDDQGRGISLLTIAPTPGAQRCERTYDYVSAQFTSVSDSCMGGVVSSVEFDPTTFFAIAVTDVAGRRARYDWDLASGRIRQATDFTGLVTDYRYEGGYLVETVGPSLDGEGKITRREYDQEFDAADQPAPMEGLDVVYWPSATDTTIAEIRELGPRLGDAVVPSLTVNWASSPAGNDGEWSAMMTGAIRIDEPGAYSFSSATPTAVLRVNNVLCADDACAALELPAGLHPIRVDLSSPESEASMSIIWSGPDTGGSPQSVPTDRLVPQYGFATTTRVIDPNAVRAPVENISRSDYDNPAEGRVTERFNQAGLASTLAYDGDTWGRQTASTLPAGNGYAYEYWGDREEATPPCPGAVGINQAGAAKSVITPGPDGGRGPVSSNWVDNAGRVAATQYADGAIGCTSYLPGGRVDRFELLGMASTQVVQNEYFVNGNPLISRSVTTIGDDITTDEIETDLAGRIIRGVDQYGTETVTTYDARTGFVATTVVTVRGHSPITIANTYGPQGWLESMSRDGRVLVRVDYNPDGTANRITYGNGVTLDQRYNQQLLLVGSNWVLPGGEIYANEREVSVGGHTSAMSYSAQGATSQFTYTNDDAGRLVEVALSPGVVPDEHRWTYSYDANSNRVGQTVTIGEDTRAYTYSYNGADQLVATDDPVAASGITYDAAGNATRVGDTTFAYDAAGRLIEATDGETTITYERSVTGALITRRVQTPTNDEVIGFTSLGITLDQSGAPIAQEMALPGGAIYSATLAAPQAVQWKFATIDGDLFFSTDDAGAPIGTPQIFDPFGQPLTEPDPLQPGVLNLAWQALTGNESLGTATPFVMMGARVYVPALGRFVQPDPRIGGSANAYDFANQNPVNAADPSGNTLWVDIAAFVVVTIATVAVSLVAPPAAGFMVGFVTGAVIGAVGYGITFGIEYAADHDTQFSLAQLLIQVGIGAITGGIGGRLQWASAVRTARYLGYEQESLTTMFVARNARDLRSIARFQAEYGRFAESGGNFTEMVPGVWNGVYLDVDRVAVSKIFDAMDRLTALGKPQSPLVGSLQRGYAQVASQVRSATTKRVGLYPAAEETEVFSSYASSLLSVAGR